MPLRPRPQAPCSESYLPGARTCFAFRRNVSRCAISIKQAPVGDREIRLVFFHFRNLRSLGKRRYPSILELLKLRSKSYHRYECQVSEVDASVFGLGL